MKVDVTAEPAVEMLTEVTVLAVSNVIPAVVCKTAAASKAIAVANSAARVTKNGFFTGISSL